MNRILATTYTGGFPLMNNDIEWLQDNIESNIASILQTFDNASNWIMNGFEDDGSRISAGVFAHDSGSGPNTWTDKIYTMEQDFQYTNIDDLWVVNDYSFDVNGNKTFKDGLNHDTWQKQHCEIIEQSTTPIGYDWYVKYTDIQNERIGKTITDKIFKDYNADYFFNTARSKYVPTWTDLVYGVGYTNGGRQTLRYTINPFNQVTIEGYIYTTSKTYFTSSQQLFILPPEIQTSNTKAFDIPITTHYNKINYIEDYKTTAHGVLTLPPSGIVNIVVDENFNASPVTSGSYGAYINITYSLD